MIVAIDGPAGAGKSSVARQLAERVGFTHLDSGAFYRCFTYLALKTDISINDADGWTEIIENHTIEADYQTIPAKFLVDGLDVSQTIRDNNVSRSVAKVSTHAVVRQAVVNKLRTVSRQGNFIVDGRDIGSVVFPDADLKFFLTASISERARRRYDELKAKGAQVELSELENEIRLRDQTDSTRELDPLVQADDAELIDSTEMSLEQVVEYIGNRIKSNQSYEPNGRQVVNL